MRASAVRIGSISLAVPGTSRQHGLDVAHDVVRRIAAAVPPTAAVRALGTVRITVTAPPGATPAQMSELIAAAIARSLA